SLQRDQIKAGLNKVLPSGITIIDILPFSKQDQNSGDIAKYNIALKDYNLSLESIDEFMNLLEWLEEGLTKKGKKKITDLRRAVKGIKLLEPDIIEMELIKDKDKIVRPAKILLKCFKVPEEIVQTAIIVKLKQDV
ncbi:MAG: DUF2344 domain-containing protein, partial [Desulfobacteraceae bacterium]|nr:DUF2344 domain-containing protein [Desulfobacteraceae bacterium]